MARSFITKTFLSTLLCIASFILSQHDQLNQYEVNTTTNVSVFRNGLKTLDCVHDQKLY